MKTLVILLLACCFGSAMAQSNLPACHGSRHTWTNCYGTHTYPSGSKYVGEWKDGSHNGIGTYIFFNGNQYFGEHKNSFADGLGTYTYADGEKYLGEHRFGKPNGKGITFRSDGSIKESGIYENGILTRSETIDPVIFSRIKIAPNLSNFNGGKLHTIEDLDAIRRLSQLPLCEGKLISLWDNCVGDTKLANIDARDSRGLWTVPKIALAGDNFHYRGEFKDGLPDGLGIYLTSRGQRYEGALKKGKFEGEGIFYSERGEVISSGTWKNDVLIRRHDISRDTLKVERQPPSPNVVIATAAESAKANATSDELENLRAEAERAKREKAELEAQLAAAQQQTQTKPTAPLAIQGKRVALVIGNAKYRFSPLNNPVNDATDMAASLRSVGFDVIEVKDATLKQMREATRRFADKLEVSDVGLVYYSGHGIEVKGKNYLIPVNADIRREYEVVDQAFDASNLLRMMESLQSNVKKRVNILIVDACRNNDLPKSWRSTNSGLARMDAPAGSFISFATAPGQVASDGQGRNSPYTKHLLNALKQPNVPIEQVFKQVRRNVMDETGGEQVPWENSSLIGDFYFTVAR
jgi:hypothetical protein